MNKKKLNLSYVPKKGYDPDMFDLIYGVIMNTNY